MIGHSSGQLNFSRWHRDPSALYDAVEAVAVPESSHVTSAAIKMRQQRLDQFVHRRQSPVHDVTTIA
jgi:hypothetical protein